MCGKRKPLKVPVFDHLDNLYDSELEFYESYWRGIKERTNTEDSITKHNMLLEEMEKRNGAE